MAPLRRGGSFSGFVERRPIAGIVAWLYHNGPIGMLSVSFPLHATLRRRLHPCDPSLYTLYTLAHMFVYIYIYISIHIDTYIYIYIHLFLALFLPLSRSTLLPSRSDLPYPAGSVLRFLVTRTHEGVTRWLPTLIE